MVDPFKSRTLFDEKSTAYRKWWILAGTALFICFMLSLLALFIATSQSIPVKEECACKRLVQDEYQLQEHPLVLLDTPVTQWSKTPR